jgi:hypothetical protein
LAQPEQRMPKVATITAREYLVLGEVIVLFLLVSNDCW